MATNVLLAGDLFVRNDLLVDALDARVDRRLSIRELSLGWPETPFGPVGEVDEASGTEDEIVAALQDVEICLTQMAPLTQRILDACPQLRLFGVGRGGPVNVNLAAATERGVLVSFAPGRNATATAEHTVGLILAAQRRIASTHVDLVAGRWRGDYYRFECVGAEIRGSTVGLVGYGAIGRQVAALLTAFGATVLAFDPYTDPSSVVGRVELTSLDDLLSRSSVVSLHARLTPETQGMIGHDELRRLPAGAVLVNCARGGLLDYEALCDALDDGHLAAAGVDVFPEEPLPPNARLLRTPHLVVTPHLAGASQQTARNAAAILADDVARYLAGEIPRYCANPEASAHDHSAVRTGLRRTRELDT